MRLIAGVRINLNKKISNKLLSLIINYLHSFTTQDMQKILKENVNTKYKV